MSSGNEKIDHPLHYNHGPLGADGTARYEPIKVIDDWSLGFCMGNALKYILRAPHKGAEMQDLAKARWYLSRNILYPDHVNRDGPEFSMPAKDVAAAWGLNNDLSQCVWHIEHGDARSAIKYLDEHIAKTRMENIK